MSSGWVPILSLKNFFTKGQHNLLISKWDAVLPSWKLTRILSFCPKAKAPHARAPQIIFRAPQLRFTSAPNIFTSAPKYLSQALQSKIIITPYVLDNLHKCPKIGLSQFCTKINVFTSAPKWFSWLVLKSSMESQWTHTLDHFPERPKMC